MNMTEYQITASRTNMYPDDVMMQCLSLGLVSEAGEVADKLKKFYRDTDRGAVAKARLVKDLMMEIGDCLWYVSQIAAECGYNMDEVAIANLNKLKSRAHRGKINGSGDDR